MPQGKRGATGVAYGLVVGLIAIAALGAITDIGENVDGLFGTVSDEMNDVVIGAASSSDANLVASPASTGNADVTGPTGPATGTPVIVTFTNSGGLGTGMLSTAASSSNYPVSADSCNGVSLAPSASCTVTVTPTASSDGALMGQVTVGDGASSAVATFSGTASGFVGTDCFTILAGNPAATDGTYTIDPDDAGPGGSYTVLCDMTTDGGGWTRALVFPSSGLVSSENVWSNDYQIQHLGGSDNLSNIAFSRLSSTSTGHDLDMMWEIAGVKQRIYRNLPLSSIWNGNGILALNIAGETKTIGGNFISIVDSTGHKGGLYYGMYDGSSATDAPLGYQACGWLFGNGAIHGVSSEANCSSAGGYTGQTDVSVEIWLR